MLADLGATVLRIERTDPVDLGTKLPARYDLFLRNRLSMANAACCKPRIHDAFVGDQPYTLAHAPPINIARSLSLRRSVRRKASTDSS